MIIPPAKLDPEVLNSILEEFITREGTDYGLDELNLQEKVAKLYPQVLKGEVLILFDEQYQTLQLINKQDYAAQPRPTHAHP
ncbi:MAG TPA: YheU family protein [Marinagarivorans sp.]